MAIKDDFSVANDGSGDIRYTGDGSTHYTVLEFKNYLGALIDDEQASGDDLADITTETIYERSTDQILTLNSPFNIDDTAAEHLYDGSISQSDGDDIWGGLYIVGVVESGTEPIIIQDNKILTPYWGTGINPDAAENIIMRIMVRYRKNGANIGNRKIRVMAREFNDSYAEFDVTLGLANAVAAIFTSNDLNNDTVSTTVEGWTSIVNTEGFQELDIDGTGASGQEFYSKWDIGTQSLNDTYERTKWIQKRAESADSNSETGNDFTVDNATTTGIGAEFSARNNDQKLVEAKLKLKIGAGIPTGNMYCELYDSDEASPPKPTGSVLATSEIKDVNRLSSSYQEVIFRFHDNVTLNADQEYFIVIQHPDGDASNYIQAEGDTSTGDDGSYAYYSGSWIGVGTSQLWFGVKSCPIIHSIAGELFRGINYEIVYDGGSGTFTEDEVIVWGTRVVYDNLNGSFDEGMYVSFWNGSTWVNAGKVLYDNGSTEMIVALEIITGGTLADGYDIKDVNNPSTNYATIDTTIENQDKAGGEGLLLAHDDNTGTGDVYIQLLFGAAPVNNLPLRGLSSSATALVNTTVTSRTISPEFVGQSTGSNIIGAYGIGFDPNDVGANDTFFDLSNNPRTPPNNVTFTVAGLISGEDRILVGPRSGSVLNKAQYTLQTTLNGGTETSIIVTTAIQTETPSDGSTLNTRLRVELDTGIYRRQAYTSWSGSTFTIPSSDYTDPNDASSGNDVFVAYIDVLADGSQESFTAVHATDRDILIRVRDGGATPIKTYEYSAVFTASPQTVTINRVSDA